MSTVLREVTLLVGVPHAHLVQLDMPALTPTKMLQCSAHQGAIPLDCNQHALHVHQDCKSDIDYVIIPSQIMKIFCVCSACPFIDASTMVACGPGFYSLGNQSCCTACPEGYECPSQTTDAM